MSLAAVAVTTMAFMGKVGVAEAYLDLVRMVMVYEGGTSAPSQDRSGVYGSGNDSNMGVHGDSFSGAGVYGASNWGIGGQGWSASKWAARFSGIPGGGNVEVTGYLSSSGKLFKIDHPL